MKNIQKFIIPGLVVVVVAMLYFTYFAPSDELGSFSRFDANNNASLPIIVKYVKEKGAQRSSDGSYSFYVLDGDNTEMLVYGLRSLPPGMDDSKTIVVTGHLSGRDSFHAHGIELRN
jgi:cytochrome c-type biogenesis protein CcmE